MNTSPSHTLKGNRLSIRIIIICILAFSLPLKAQRLSQSTNYAPEIRSILKSVATKPIIQEPETGKLVLTFTDIRSTKGNILLALFVNDTQWTDHPYKEYVFSKENLQNDSFRTEINELPLQTYAIALMDDEDANSKMNYFCGIPKEGFGMSTNPSFFKLKKPKFNDVIFHMDSTETHISIKLHYINPNKKIK